MSQFISDQDLEVFVRDVLQEEPRRKETAMRLSDRIAEQKIYEERVRCDCSPSMCACLLPMDLDGTKIQAGDGFDVRTADGREFTFHALGVRTVDGRLVEIFTAGWPAGCYRVQDGDIVSLERKGKGITKHQLLHRRANVGGGWDDGL